MLQQKLTLLLVFQYTKHHLEIFYLNQQICITEGSGTNRGCSFFYRKSDTVLKFDDPFPRATSPTEYEPFKKLFPSMSGENGATLVTIKVGLWWKRLKRGVRVGKMTQCVMVRGRAKTYPVQSWNVPTSRILAYRWSLPPFPISTVPQLHYGQTQTYSA